MNDATVPRRRTLKRVVLWTLAAMFLLVWYVASPPLVGYFIAQRFPAAVPLLEAFYAPMEYYWSHHDLPRSERYGDYVDWCHGFMARISG